jgi:hypothetical protein
MRRLLTVTSGSHPENRFTRQAFLRLMLGAGLIHNGAPLRAIGESLQSLLPLPDLEGCGRVDSETVASYETVTTAYERLYWTTPASTLFNSAMTQLDLGLHLLRMGLDGDASTATFAAAVMRSALLAGRIAFFDLGQPVVAQDCLNTARELSSESSDHALAAVIYGHLAFIPGFANDATSALSCVGVAQRHATYAGSPLIRSWLHCVSAEFLTRAGQPKAGLVKFHLAEDAIQTVGSDPPWIDFYDESRLHGFGGYALLAAGKPAEAASQLENALERLAPNANKQRSVLLFDLATAYAPLDPVRAVQLAGEAYDTLQSNGYAVARDRVLVVRNALRDCPSATALAERTTA